MALQVAYLNHDMPLGKLFRFRESSRRLKTGPPSEGSKLDSYESVFVVCTKRNRDVLFLDMKFLYRTNQPRSKDLQPNSDGLQPTKDEHTVKRTKTRTREL